MKSLTVKNRVQALLAGVALSAAGLMSAQAANSTFITFSVDMANAPFTIGTDTVSVNGTFNGWGAFPLKEVGNTTVYTNTFNDTADANGGTASYKFVIDGNNWENLPTGQNRAAKLPSTVGASIVQPTAFFADNGTPVANDVTFQVDVSQQIALGNFTPGTSSVEVRGLFNGWSGGASELTNNPNILVTNQFGLVTSNVWQGTFPVTASPGGVEAFKYVINPGTEWEGPSSANTDSGGNRYFANVAQTLPLVNFSDAPYAPLAKVTFNVDMSGILLSDPGYDPTSVTLNGSFNGWGASIPCTNNPSAANPNVYTAVVAVGEGSSVFYQFRYTSSGNTKYDNIPSATGNRSLIVPQLAATNIPAVFFNNISPNDLLNVDTTVYFTVNMTNAVDYVSHAAFDPNNDTVFINGDFLGWAGWNAIALGSYILANDPVGSELYTFSYTFPAGHSRSVSYKYSINGTDNEAGQNQNHFRYIRSTTGTYYMPLDSFGVQTVETKFGSLTISPLSSTLVHLSWLGYPNVTLQSAPAVTGPWTSNPDTTGSNSSNFQIVPGGRFFRLIQP